VGLTSKAVQQQLGVDQPDVGVLFDDMEYLDGDAIPMARLIQPKVDAEMAFVVGRDLDRDRPAWGEFVNALAYALPALEIVDSVIQDWKITLVDTVVDTVVELGKRRMVGGQEDMIVDVALDLLKSQERGPAPVRMATGRASQ